MMPVTIDALQISCINQAAVTYHVPATLILAIMIQEHGRNAQAVRNKNGTYDLGILQINTRWLPVLARYGYTRNDIQYDPCKNIMVGSWILAKSLAQGHTLWSGIGNYHSHTPEHNQSYRKNIYAIYQKLNTVLKP